MDVKVKHEKISHGGLQLFCHYVNNQKTCPFASECVFLHQEAGLCKYGARCVRINCMFKHIILEYSDDDSDDDGSEGDDDEEERDVNEDDVDAKSENNVMEGEDVETEKRDVVLEQSANETVESVELTVYLECKDYWLSKDQAYYMEQLNKFSEIERVDDLWINTKPNYNVGTYLEANLKFRTKFANQFRNEETVRQSIWDRLKIKDICPEQG